MNSNHEKESPEGSDYCRGSENLVGCAAMQIIEHIEV
jgi:hypothetical protein